MFQHLLAEGEPVTLDQVAAVSSRPVACVEAFLRQHPGTDWDERGWLVGLGLTIRPTPHRFTFDGRAVYGWCATDTLIFPVLLGRFGVIESTCPATGRPIRIEVTPQGVAKVDPSGAVVSLVRPDRFSDMRAEGCDLGLFFASREATAQWRAAHPEGMVHTVEEEFQLNREMTEREGGHTREARHGNSRRWVRPPRLIHRRSLIANPSPRPGGGGPDPPPAAAVAPGRTRPPDPYQVIAAELRTAIFDGALPPGTTLPTVEQLATRHDVAPSTAHRAPRNARPRTPHRRQAQPPSHHQPTPHPVIRSRWGWVVRLVLRVVVGWVGM